MAAHAMDCNRLREKHFPVCDGYCCRRAKAAHDGLEERFLPPRRSSSASSDQQRFLPHRHRRRPTSGGASSKVVERKSWMMKESVAVHWKPVDMKPVRRPPPARPLL